MNKTDGQPEPNLKTLLNRFENAVHQAARDDYVDGGSYGAADRRAQAVTDARKALTDYYDSTHSRLSADVVAPTVDETHPEDFCQKCNRVNVVWFAPNELWNKAVRAAEEPEILCPICFIQLAEAAGVTGAAWKVVPQNHHSLNQPVINAIQSAAQEVVDVAYRDRGQVPHRDTIVSIFSQHLIVAAATPAPQHLDRTKGESHQ